MDHAAQLSKMDPKLKEAYERVMGTQHETASTFPAQTVQASSPQPNTSSPQASSQSIQPTSQIASAEMSDEIPRMEVPLRRSTQTVYFGGGVSNKPLHAAPLPVLTSVATQKKKSTISPILIIVILGTFFLMYTAFWIKILGVPIPYLNP